jgi:hypothetical protein
MSGETKKTALVGIVLCLCVVVCLTITDRSLKVAVAADAQQATVASVFESYPLRTISHKRNAAGSNLRSIRSAQAEQTVKNIQVLKGLPESQLFLVMNFVATSLGVHCNFCHVQQGKDPNTGVTKWVWESDDKPEKRTARGMMQMVLAIKANDKVDFRGNEVTCYTCHRGQRKPIGIPAMPLARSGHEGPDATLTERTTLPSVEQIFIKYVEALGGGAATGTRTLVLKGKREASQNRNWPNEITLAAPDRFLLVATMPETTVRQIINGDKGWIVNGTNVRNLPAATAVEARHSYDELFNVIKVKPSQNMRLIGTRKVGERDAYLVENVTDTKIERFYFDSQTGLLLRKMTVQKTMLMPFPEQVDFEDYRDVDGVKVPFTIRYSAIDTYDSWTRTFTEIKRNAVLSDSLFATPGESRN